MENYRNAKTPIQKSQFKKKALQVLKKKKMYESLGGRVVSSQMTMESTYMQSEMMQGNMDMVK
jgi:hypothetical protein